MMQETELNIAKEEVFISNSHGAHSRIRSSVDIDAIDYTEASDIVELTDLNDTGTGTSQGSSE